MATWSQNSVPTSTFNASTFGPVFSPLLDGTKWGGALGQGVQLTWSFPNLSSSYLSNYSSLQEYEAFRAFSTAEKNISSDAIGAWTTLCGLSAILVNDDASVVGELRFARTSNVSPDEGAHAYLPGDHPSAGDIWMRDDDWHTGYSSAVVKGTYDYLALMHEIGHALGLKHPFEGPNIVANVYDSYLYTVMSYEAKAGTNSNYATFYPTTPMYLDIAAMHTLYGRDTATRTGNDTYTFTQGNRYWQTIYDAGGSDTIVYKGSANCAINLNIGSFSTLSDAIFFNDNSSTRATVCIGPATIIERAVGGSGNDTLTGNSAANSLFGNAGRDVLVGGSGNDRLFGGLGNDRLTGGAHKDVFYFNTALNANVDSIVDFKVVDDAIYLENAIFTKLSATGVLSKNFFRIGSAPADTNDFITYNRATGTLSYDANGSGAGLGTVFAKLSAGLTPTNADFFVV
jgi:Ca2+-binding RTX toxin-like protein